MVPLAQLWAPILLSAFLVFVTSSLIHMVLKWHNSDYQKLPNEDEVRAAMQRGSPAPGQYVIPWCVDMKQMGTPEVQQKYKDGPVGMIYLQRPGVPNMGPTLGKWFVFTIVASFFVAYVSSRTLAPGTEDLRVLQLAGTVAFMGYALGDIPNAIWLGKPWKVVMKDVVDALLYGMVTGGTFVWLWPKM